MNTNELLLKMQDRARQDAEDDAAEVWDNPVLSADGILSLAARRANWLGVDKNHPEWTALLSTYAQTFVEHLEAAVVAGVQARPLERLVPYTLGHIGRAISALPDEIRSKQGLRVSPGPVGMDSTGPLLP